MKTLLLLAAVAITGLTVQAQQDKSKRASPPAKATATLKSGAIVTIDYSQPSVKGRMIGNEIAPYGKVWRLGANEPTTLELSKDVTIQGKSLPAGKYSMYAIPAESEWIIIINSEIPRWGINRDGSTTFNTEKDVLRLNIKPTKTAEFTEKMTFNIDESGKIGFMWGDVKLEIPVK
jgi:hypothetical protein